MFKKRKINDIKSIETSQAFCMKPWVHLFVSQLGTIVPCCLTSWEKDQALGHVNEQEVREIWNGRKMRKFRRTMLSDVKDKRCWQCYDNEKNGLQSKRNIVNFLYSDKIDWVNETNWRGYSRNSKPIYWDIRISNLCNLKCRICGHHSSSSWFDDAKALGLITHDKKVHRGPKNFDRLIEQLEFAIPHLEEVYFAGGEPLIMKEHYEMLQLFIERKKTDIKLRYNTNFSQAKYKNHDLFLLWKKFDEVFVHASLDGMAERGELQRSGQRWDDVISERKRMMETCPDVDFMVTPTISVFNVLHVSDFHKNWVEMGLIDVDEFIPHVLRDPAFYNIRILPQSIKMQAEKNLLQHIDWIRSYIKNYPPKKPSQSQLDKWSARLGNLKIPEVTGHVKLDMLINELHNSITYMHAKDEVHLIPEFIAHTQALDELRAENTRKTFPELNEIWTTRI